MLRRILCPKREQVTVKWEKQNSEGLKIDIYREIFSGDQIKMNELGGSCSMHE